MALFLITMQPLPGMKILDMGGQPTIWEHVDIPLKVTFLNLPGTFKKRHASSHHQMAYVEGDACSMPTFQPGDFDLVFSNSVIEHVGNNDKRRDFAQEVMRLSNKYWIQTPAKVFPIEAHCGMPFWWFYPEALRSRYIHGWERNLSDTSSFWLPKLMNSTVAVTASELRGLLPNCKIMYERFLGMPKSVIAYSRGEVSG
jgi:hypothetical protein